MLRKGAPEGSLRSAGRRAAPQLQRNAPHGHCRGHRGQPQREARRAADRHAR